MFETTVQWLLATLKSILIYDSGYDRRELTASGRLTGAGPARAHFQ